MVACDRAIASGKFTGHYLSYLYSDRGFMRMQTGEIDLALADLSESARIDSSNFYAFWNRGAVYAAKGEFDRAQGDFTTALAQSRQDLEGQDRRGPECRDGRRQGRQRADFRSVGHQRPVGVLGTRRRGKRLRRLELPGRRHAHAVSPRDRSDAGDTRSADTGAGRGPSGPVARTDEKTALIYS